MILIFTDKQDQSTVRVCKWLCAMEVPYKLVYPDSGFDLVEISINDKKVEVVVLLDGQEFSLDDIFGLWYRRGQLPYYFNADKYHDKEVERAVKHDFRVLYEYVLHRLNSLPSINKVNKGDCNKFIALDVAIASGLTVPNTVVTPDINRLDIFYSQNSPCITKAISEIPRMIINDNYCSHGTILLEQKPSEIWEGNELGQSLLQNAIEKDFELRVFHLLGENHSMAIFSKYSEKTKVDSRDFDYGENLIPLVPYELPKGLNSKINVFMEKMGLNTGSLDFIVTPSGEFVFLEVNPIGQYAYMTFFCNYDIDKLIATKLKSFYDQRDIR